MTEPAIAFDRRKLAEQWLAYGSESLRLDPSILLGEEAKYQLQMPSQRRNSRFSAREQTVGGRQSLVRYMETLSLGSHPGEWGILSGGQADMPYGGRTITLENTLRAFKETIPLSQQAVTHINRALSMLPTTRAQMELGLDAGHLGMIEANILELANEVSLGHENRRKLIVHLPSRIRPVPESLGAMECSLPPVTLHVEFQDTGQSWPGPKDQPRLKMQDLIVDSGLRGRGLGTATLAEICRYADTRGLSLWGVFDPSVSDDALERLARWYIRMGFVRASSESGPWRRRLPVVREPQ